MDRLLEALDIAAIIALAAIFTAIEELVWQYKRLSTEVKTRRIMRQFRKTL